MTVPENEPENEPESLTREKGSEQVYPCPVCSEPLTASEPRGDGSVTLTSHDHDAPSEQASTPAPREVGTVVPNAPKGAR